MKINTADFWENIGMVFENPDDIYSEVSEDGEELDDESFCVLQKGTYSIIGRETHGYDLYEIKTGKLHFFEPGWVDDLEFNVFYMNPNDTLDILIEAVNKKIIQLAAEGWVVDPENKYFNLLPYMQYLESLVYSKKIVEGIN